MKFAYVDDWLRSALASNGALQLACGHGWETVAMLIQLAGSVAHLSALQQLPGVQIAVVAMAGDLGYMAIRCHEIEIRVHPVDQRGRLVNVTSGREVWSLPKVLISEVIIRGRAVAPAQVVTA